MKNILIAATIALAATAASAVDVGVTVGRDYADTNRNVAGVTVGQKLANDVVVTAGYERTNAGEDQNRYSATAGFELARLGQVAFSPKVGVAYLDNSKSGDGYAMTVGFGAELPLTPALSLTADISRQFGQDRVEQFNGNRFTTGLKYSFR